MIHHFRRLIYFLKRQLHHHPALYAFAYFLATFNLDFFRQIAQRRYYPSHFGGHWTDRTDFQRQLDKKLSFKTLTPATVPLLEQWRTQGFIVLPGAVSAADIDVLLKELDDLPRHYPPGLKVTGAGYLDSRPYHPDRVKAHQSTRIVDYYFYSAAARKLLFNPQIIEFLRVVLESEPVLTQSLSFEFGSEQNVHRDTAFVIMNSPLKFAAAWIALEDVQPGSGELVYYPGSHLWGDYLFSGRFKHWDRERDGMPQLMDWYDWLHRQAAIRGTPLAKFRPKKGDVLLWHGGLAHGGATIETEGLTRRSLVGHYCPRGVRPLYHYYKPAHRKIHRVQGQSFSSSHYREESGNP